MENIITTNSTPIICLMCKSARKGEERLFMFGGNRPFMAKFEAKLIAFIGRDKLSALRDKYKTKRDRSYICKHCYSVVDKTFDNIKKIQRGVAKTVRKLDAQDGMTDDDYDSDLEWGMGFQGNTPKKKLPPVAERIAEKVASLTLVKINHKVPKIVLEPVTLDLSADNREQSTDIESDDASEDSHDHMNTAKVKADSHEPESQMAIQTVMLATNTDHQNMLGTETHSSPGIFHSGGKSNFHPLQPQMNAPGDGSVMSLSQTQTFLNVVRERNLMEERSHANEGTNSEGSGGQANGEESSLKEAGSQRQDTEDLDKENFYSNKPSADELAEILANPLLMVKAPQPIKLPDVKNENIYICGEDGCDWIFSSKFFWENHIRHYHYYGKPHKCPFEGCNKYFPTISKQKQHVRKHTGERPFVCEECGKAFRGCQELRHHRGTHTIGKPYQCPKPDCYKRFKYLNSMKRHLQFHDGNYPFPCSYPKCTKAFKNKYELKCHYRLHTGEKPYKCKEQGCGKAFRLPCEYTKHRRAHTGERPFRCTWDGCNAAYITCGGLASHLLSHSNDQHFCCEFCGKTFKHKLSYRSHLKQHTGTPEAFPCKVEGCDKIYHLKGQLQNHMANVHGQLEPSVQRKRKRKAGSQVYSCPVEECGKEYIDRRSIDQHMVTKHNIHNHQPQLTERKKFFICQEEGCEGQYSTDGGLRYHRLTVHTKGAFEDAPGDDTVDSRTLACPYDKCERVYEDASSLRDHLARAHVSMPREKMCPLCGQAFPHIQQLELHVHGFHEENSVLNEHAKGIFVCNVERCGQNFQNADELRNHVNWHITNPPYRCEVEDCMRTFLLEKVYSNHILEHKNLKPHTCTFEGCQEGFATLLKLLKHSKTHYGNFKCPIDGCGKMLQAINSARIHVFRHTGEKPYACTVCGRRFAACAQWIRHKRTHTGEKPYECDVCHTKFADGGILKIHMRTHTGEKPFECEKCGQRFVSQATRKSHMRIHTGELPFVCPEEGCFKAFRESGSLKSHQNVHSKPSHLCSQCGKVYKFSINKHKCKVESPEQNAQPLPPTLPPSATTETLPEPIQPLQMQPLQLPQTQIQPLPQPTLQSLPQPTLQQHQLLQHQQPLHQPMLPPPPPPQYNMNSLMMMTEPAPVQSSFVAEVEEAARAGKDDYNPPVSQDTVLMQDADRNLMISSPYYNYMILYDRSGQQ